MNILSCIDNIIIVRTVPTNRNVWIQHFIIVVLIIWLRSFDQGIMYFEFPLLRVYTRQNRKHRGSTPFR